MSDDLYDMFKPEECYYLKRCELQEVKGRPYFWQMMSWCRHNEEGQEVVEVKGYCYGKN